MIDLIEHLKSRYNQPISLVSYLKEKYGQISSLNEEKNKFEQIEIENKKVNEFEAEEEEERVYLTFKCDASVNREILEGLIKSIKKYEQKDFEIQKDCAVSKLVKNYIKELKKLRDDSMLDESEKIANSYIRILKKTLNKLWGNKQFSKTIEKYLKENSICLEEYEEGHRLTDDDLEFLDEELVGIFAVKTNNPNDKYKVIEMIQPIIKIYYEDEDEEDNLGYKYLSGNCKFYK